MQVRGTYLDTAARQVHALTSGHEGPWLVLHHESPLSARVFEPALSMLGEHFRVLALDTPGYGVSPPPAAPLTIPEYASSLLDAVRVAVGTERFAVAGVHTGASIAVEVARQSGNQASHVALLGLPAYDAATRADRLAHWAPPAAVEPDGSHLTAMWQRYDRIWDDPPLALKHRAVLDAASVLDRYHWAYHAAFGYDPLPALAELARPIRFLSAERDPLAPADRRSAALVGATVVEFAGLPGQIPARAPQRFTAELASFVAGAGSTP